MNRKTQAASGLAAALTALATLGTAAPAHASTTDSGCTVTPLRPVFSGQFNGAAVPLVDYKISVTCQAGLILHLDQRRMEQDLQAVEGDPVDDFTGSSAPDVDFTTGALNRTVRVRAALPTTGPATEGPLEEVYQMVRFGVTSGPVTSAWTPYELTQVRAISH